MLNEIFFKNLLILLSLNFVIKFNLINCYHSVLRIFPKNEKQINYLFNLEKNKTFFDLDFWKYPSNLNESFDIMINQNKIDILKNDFIKRKINFRYLINVVEDAINTEKINLMNQNLYYGENWDSSNEFFNNYHTLSDIYKFIKNLAYKYPERVNLEIIGKSSENRPLYLMKIGMKNNVKDKKVIWIDAGIHAREWIAPATALFISELLIKGPDTDAQLTELITEYDFYIMPLVNVDGYLYSHTNNRLWRKTRSVHYNVFFGMICQGVDANRNFDFHWLESGASYFSCSQKYSGPKPFSEPETKAISKKILENKNKIILYIALHSYSQLILFPWGYKTEYSPAYKDMKDKALKAIEEIRKIHDTVYKTGSSSKTLYKSSGGADDWAHGVAKIKYSYTIELRDTGNYGFLLPSNQIIPTAEEIWTGIKNMTIEIGREFGSKI